MASICNWFEPSGAAAGVVVFAPAMGVRQDFYAEFAAYLARAGFLVATMDYRGVGYNEPATLRGVDLSFIDWQQDLDDLILAARTRAPNLPILMCAHSLGGQLLGSLKHRAEVAAAITIASGNGYWRHNPRMRMRLLYLWFVAMPLYTRLFGYFPGRRLNKVGNLPREIALTWARWCRDPRYLMGDARIRAMAGYDEMTVPILSLSFSDDEYISREAVDKLHGFYSRAAVERQHHEPVHLGVKRIGHFGFFKLGEGHPLWSQVSAWLCTHQLVKVAAEANR